ncbi:DNA-damage-inducible protein F [Rhodobacteraceae bacterium THAF1]|uniref:MATE family efflux transporter n=1 Tax=Palleronia sp. THAF1 TaxID=2587842 RepID=UPI000F3C669E|nr:MATE family efflux transporter [Palleronia sp. THAF1]QFU07329.1 DNA-damage-inducible protein F [Palleronia sp. THAF1]VDC20759.1 DNA-damage-inducible protein F [Rhodobacteraceae bacterium THAF1]
MAEARPVTHKRVLAVALPIVLSNATVPILGAVDTGVVGQMGEAAPIGAVGIGAIILTALYWVFGFLRMGTTGFASQALGRGDMDEGAAILTRGLFIGVAGGLLIILFQLPLFRLAFLVSPASTEVETLARGYMGVRVWSAPALISLYAITGWLIAAERTTGVFVIQLWMNGINVALDLWFVLSLGWGVTGVAWATFIAEWSGLALGLWLCRNAFATPAWRDRARILDPTKLKRFAQVNSDILLRSLMLQAIFVSFLLLGARFGDVRLAANQILLQFLEITAFAMDGFAFAAEAIVGSALGANRRDLFRRGAIVSSIWGGVIGIALALAFWLAGGWVIDLMTTNAEVRAEARLYLPYMIAAPIVGWAAWMLDGIFIGATRTADMRNMMVISFVIYIAAVFALMPVFGNHGLWMAFLISFVARGLTLGWRYPALERSIG